MPPERQKSRLREQVRGVGYIVLLGMVIFVVALVVISLFVWIMT